jgi:hypothetical protein
LANNGTNRDLITGRNVSRPQYLIGGCQWAETSEFSQNHKRPAEGPPMMLGTTDPFTNIDDDDEWIQTFGGSLDNVFSLINGKHLQRDMDARTLGNGVYLRGSVNSYDDNLWRTADDYQQVQYIVSQSSVLEGSVSTGWYGNIEDVRGFGLRIPTMAAGYGRTIDGLPTDVTVEDDLFGRANDPQHKLDRATWKNGPIEFRWDYRTSVWSAYNEMVADHHGKNMGTWIFGSNPDNVGGYPFLRGKLEDMIYVRQPLSLKGTFGKQWGAKTGEVFTHLNHRWFDIEEDGAAPLSSIFIIPHKTSTKSPCHTKGEEHTLGDETTGEGLSIDIKTEAHFFKSTDADGPIAFREKASSLDICCTPATKKYHMGEMIFQDVLPTTCAGTSGPFAGTSILVGGELEPSCEWVPAIAIDECELMGGHMTDLIWNDVELASLNASLCAVLANYTQAMRGFLNANFTNVAFDFEDIQDEVEKALKSLILCFNNELMHVWTRFDIYRNEMEVSMDRLIDDISDVLNACCENEFNIIWNGPDSQGSHDYPDPCQVTFDKIVPLYNDFPEIPCDSCPPINLWTPCTTKNSVLITGGCKPIVPVIPISDNGCQAHNKGSNTGTGSTGTKSKLVEGGEGIKMAEVPDPTILFAGAGFIGETSPVD